MLAPTDADRMAARARPPGQPVMHQRWSHILFLHWQWDPVEIQRSLPPGLIVDTFQGKAWLGVLPSYVSGTRPRLGPPVPGLSNFLQLNVRTYVFDAQGRPGVWCYSLDANQWLAVTLGRAWFCLPYEHATIKASLEKSSGRVDYQVRRQGYDSESRFVYEPADDPGSAASEAKPGSLEFFLIERYRLFAYQRTRGLFTGRVAHEPYLIGRAEVTAWDDVILKLSGFDLSGSAPDHIALTRALDVDIYPPERVAEPEPVLAQEPEAGGAGAVAV